MMVPASRSLKLMMTSVAEILRSAINLCFAIYIAPFFSCTLIGCAFGMAGVYGIFSAPVITILMVVTIAYLLCRARLQPSLMSVNGRLRLSFSRPNAEIEGLEPGAIIVARDRQGQIGVLPQSVILILEIGTLGALGLILNYQFVETNLESHSASDRFNAVRFGGPVPNPRTYLTQQPSLGCERLADLDVFVGRNEPSEDGLLHATFDGSVRWVPFAEKLFAEIRSGNWSWIPKGTIDVHEVLRLGVEGKRQCWEWCLQHPNINTFPIE